MLQASSGHMGIWVVDRLGEHGKKVIPLLFCQCWLGLILVSSIMNGRFDQRHLTGWQFMDILAGSSSPC